MAKVQTVKSILFYYIIDTKLLRASVARIMQKRQTPLPHGLKTWLRYHCASCSALESRRNGV